MRKRCVQVNFRLDENEHQRFQRRIKKSGLNQETYLRQLITGLVPQDAPPPDYYAMMRELHAIGNNLNQIAHKANALGLIDTARFDTAVGDLNRAIVTISGAVLLPRKNENMPGPP